MRTDGTTSLLILGEFGTGKTHYGAQLLLRLNQQKGALRMRGAAVNISAFESAIESLNEGHAARHTPTSTYLESVWPIQDGHGWTFDLIWPDYGGEQIRDILAARRISPAWRGRIVQSAGWLLFVRIQHADVKDNIFSRPLASIHKAPPADKDFKMSDESRLIELLQLFLFVRGAGTLAQYSSPALTVLLTCWDEIAGVGAKAQPGEVFAKYLPLLADFVAASWQPGRASVLGLSSLGKPLDENSQDEDYKIRGPEQFGYIIHADGTQDSDLTIPISDLAALVK